MKNYKSIALQYLKLNKRRTILTILGTAITAISAKEIGAAGSAALVGTKMGVFENLSETVAKMATVRKIFYPDSEKQKIYAEHYKRYANLYSAVKSL